MSEIYLVQKSLDPEKMDPKTKKLEAPYYTLDNHISEAQPSTVEHKLEEVEIYEYRTMKEQFVYFSNKYPKNSSFKELDVPALMGNEVITCDNSEFTLANFNAKNDNNRLGLVYTVPVYNKLGTLEAAVTGVIRTKVILDSLQKNNFIIYNKKYQFKKGNQVEKWLIDSIPFLQKGLFNPELFASGIVKLNIKDEYPFELWYAFSNEEFWNRNDVKSVQTIFYVSLIGFLLAIFILIFILKFVINIINSLSKSIVQLKEQIVFTNNIANILKDESNSTSKDF